MNRLRARLNAGCGLLLVAGLALSFVVKLIGTVIDWLMGEPAGLKMAPAALSAIEVSAVIIFGPLVFAALIHVLSNGLGRTFAQIVSSWLAGFKSGLVCLLLLLPLIAFSIFKDATESDVVIPGSPAAWLRIALVLLLFIIAPFWSLLVVRHLPAVVLRGTLFERAREFDNEFGATDL